MAAPSQHARLCARAVRDCAREESRATAHRADPLARALAAAHTKAVNAAKPVLNGRRLAAALGTAPQIVSRYGSPDHRELPSIRTLALAPDAYVDALLEEIARVRLALGRAPRQWLPAPDVVRGAPEEVHAEAIRACADLQRAVAVCGDHDDMHELRARVSLRALASCRAVHALATRELSRPRRGDE